MTCEVVKDENLEDAMVSDAIFFPRDDKTSDTTMSFVETCHMAAATHCPLHLACNIDDLDATITLRKHQHLTIRGHSSSGNPYIAGTLHSLFLLNNSSRLTIENVNLTHHATEKDDCRQVGAAVNLRYKATATLRRCTITSASGFCGWAVQKATLDLEDCVLRAPMRSALVCFGQATLLAKSCKIERSGVHGVCARGECHIHLQHSRIVRSTVRGLYAYANANVILERTEISGTMRSDMAAVEVRSNTEDAIGSEAPKSKQNNKVVMRSRLTMKECRVCNNAGAGVKIRGDVLFHISDEENIFEGNKGGDVVDASAEVDDPAAAFGKDQPQRDESSSSFRQGDWWCSRCGNPKRVVPSTSDSCSRCQATKESGALLSKDEVIALNQGVWIDPTSKRVPKWLFHGDKEAHDWILYDFKSSSQLEEAYQKLRDSPGSRSTSRTNRGDLANQEDPPPTVVPLMQGKYHVNLLTMEQVNTETKFPRFVRRQSFG